MLLRRRNNVLAATDDALNTLIEWRILVGQSKSDPEFGTRIRSRIQAQIWLRKLARSGDRLCAHHGINRSDPDR